MRLFSNVFALVRAVAFVALGLIRVVVGIAGGLLTIFVLAAYLLIEWLHERGSAGRSRPP